MLAHFYIFYTDNHVTCEQIHFCLFLPNTYTCYFLSCLLLGVLWAPWVCGLVSVINSGKSLAFIILNISPFLFSHSSVSDVIHLLYLCSYPTVLGYSFYFFILSLIFCLESFIYISSNSLILSPTVSNILMHPSKTFFISITLFLNSRISFWFFS